jgi:hypothetical protein
VEQLEIEIAAFDEFLILWKDEIFQQQRLGQAFYNTLESCTRE